MLSRHISYPKVMHQNHFWHVPQTCPNIRNATVCPAWFLGVDQALGTCGTVHDMRKVCLKSLNPPILTTGWSLVFFYHGCSISTLEAMWKLHRIFAQRRLNGNHDYNGQFSHRFRSCGRLWIYRFHKLHSMYHFKWKTGRLILTKL